MAPVRNSESLVVLTRPLGQNEGLRQTLAQRGLATLVLPAIHITEPPVRNGLPDPAQFDLVVFVSSHASRFFLKAWQASSRADRWPVHTLAATVGQGSAQPLYACGKVPPEQIVHPSTSTAQDSESLLALLEEPLRRVKRALIVRGQDGREWLGEQLEMRGIQVQRHVAYIRAPYVWPDSSTEGLEGRRSGKGLIWVLTSSHSVQAVHAQLQERHLLNCWDGAQFVVIHERIASRLQSLLKPLSDTDGKQIRVCNPGDPSILQAVLSLASARNCQGLQSRHD